MIIVVTALLVISIRSAVSSSPPIVYKNVNDFTEIWNDAGSGADDDVSYWHPRALAYDYFPLGDVVTASHSKPDIAAVLVKELVPGALKPPRGFSEIWNDRGSGADSDVRIFRMDPHSGYTCLGNAVVVGYSSTPAVSIYRCVKNQYVTPGALSLVWKDAGSGAHRDVSNWIVIRGSDVNSQESGCFLSVASHSQPSQASYLLSSNYAKNHLLVNVDLTNPETKLKLFKMTDIDIVWKDSGSGGRHDFSCWRVNGPANTYRLADIPMGNYAKPGYALMAKAVESSALQAPADYRLRWSDRGSGANWDGAFWEPICNGGYVAMGHLCTRNYNKPSTNDMRCVRADLVSTGTWHWVWNDGGTGADQDCSVYRAATRSSDQQAVDAMGAIGAHRAMDRTAYVLQGAKTMIVDGKPVRKYIISNVHYNLDDRNILNSELTNLGRLVVENRGDTEQSATRTLTGLWSETRSWSQSFGIEFSVSVETEASVPFIGKSTVTVGVTTSFSYETGGSVTEEHSDSVAATVTVKPHHQKTVIMVGTNYKADIPYTADIITEYEDGTKGYRNGVAGIYTGVNVADRRVIYEDDIPL